MARTCHKKGSRSGVPYFNRHRTLGKTVAKKMDKSEAAGVFLITSMTLQRRHDASEGGFL